MEKVVVELEAKTAKAEAGLNDVVDAIKSLNKAVVDSNSKTEKSLKDVENQSKKSTNIVKKLAKGFTGVGLAMKAAGFALIIKTVNALGSAMTSNQKVVDLMSSAFETISIILSQVSDVFISMFEKVSDLTGGFDALRKVLSGGLSIAINIVVGAIQGIVLGVQKAQLAWEKSFFGDGDPKEIKRLNLAITETQEKLVETGERISIAGKQIANNFVEAVGEVGSLAQGVAEAVSESIEKIDVKQAISDGKRIANAKKNFELLALQQQRLVEKYDLQAEQQRQIRDDESKSIEDRIKANDELAKILDKQEEAMLKNADIAVASAKAELDKNKENIQLQKAYEEALNEQSAIEAQITGFRSEQQTNTNSLLREQREIMNEIALFGKSERDKERLELEQQYEANKLLIEKEITDDAEKKERLLAAETDYKAQLKVLNDGFDAEDLETKQLKVDKEIELEQKKTAAKYQALNDLQSIFGAESAMGKAALIGKQLLAAQELLIDLGVMKSKATKAIATASLDGAESSSSVATGLAKTLKLGFPKAIPALIGYAASAAAIIGGVISATKKTK